MGGSVLPLGLPGNSRFRVVLCRGVVVHVTVCHILITHVVVHIHVTWGEGKGFRELIELNRFQLLAEWFY